MEFPWTFLLKYGKDLEVLSIFGKSPYFFLVFEGDLCINHIYIHSIDLCLVTYFRSKISPHNLPENRQQVGLPTTFAEDYQCMRQAMGSTFCEKGSTENLGLTNTSNFFGGPVVNSISESHFLEEC